MTPHQLNPGDEVLYNGLDAIVIQPKTRGVTIQFLYRGLARIKFVKYTAIHLPEVE